MQEEFSEIMRSLSENARFALQKADYYSKRYNNGYMGTEHLLLGILDMDACTGAHLLRDEGVPIVTNCPVTALMIAFEMFGFGAGTLFLLVVAVTYLFSGYFGIWSSQMIRFSKYDPGIIDRKTH